MNAAVYARVSTALRRRRDTELMFEQRPEVQAEPLCKFAETRGWNVTRVYSDRMNGTSDVRPALTELMADARRGSFDVLLIWRFDRLSRSVPHFLQIVNELRQLGIELVSYEQNFDTTTAMGNFTLTMFAALAELEREVIRERVQAGIDYARLHGTKSGKPIGRPPAVFRRDQARELRNAGNSWRTVARKLGVSIGSVRRACQDTSEERELCQKPR
jgi:DNA invertase Pin-like site-specific DNA recombinase